MPKGIYQVPYPENEPVKDYAPGSDEKIELKVALAEAKSEQREIPMYIGRSGSTIWKYGNHASAS